MKDIALAYQEEIRYYNDKQRLHSNVLNILDYIGKAGYDNYDEYYTDLQEYLLKTQDYEIVEEPEINANIPLPYITNNRPAFLYTINCGTNYAFIPNSINDYSLIKEYGYTPVKLGYDGSSGPILSSDGDLRIYLVYPVNIDLSYGYFSEKMVCFLSKYFTDIKSDNNDIMLDGKKIIGGASTVMNNMRVVVFQINFIDKQSDIQSICGKTNKIPGHIDKTILSAVEFKNEFLSWLKI